MNISPAKAYLGDGVYVSCDGHRLWLTTTRDGREESIGLEPEVYRALRAYARREWGAQS
jgi:hypothetical protein